MIVPLLLLLLLCSSASAHTWPAHCRDARAETLCRIHRNVNRTNQLRARMGQAPLPYRWVAEAHPARRPRLLAYWIMVRQDTLRRWTLYQQAPWLHDPFHAQAMCIHSKESIDWHDPGSPGGGVQFLESTWLAWGGAKYAPTPGAASPVDQLRVAYRVVQHDGDWHEWSTHSLCGL